MSGKLIKVLTIAARSAIAHRSVISAKVAKTSGFINTRQRKRGRKSLWRLYIYEGNYIAIWVYVSGLFACGYSSTLVDPLVNNVLRERERWLDIYHNIASEPTDDGNSFEDEFQ